MEIKGPAIAEIPILTIDACADIMKKAKDFQFKPNSSLHMNNKSGAFGANEHVYLRLTQHQNVEMQLFAAIYTAAEVYQESYQVKLAEGTDLEIIRYQSGGGAALHADICKGLCSPVSALVYLNQNYEGGELCFPEFSIQFKPKAGSVVFFPAHFAYMHETSPLISGHKVVAYCTLTDTLTQNA